MNQHNFKKKFKSRQEEESLGISRNLKDYIHKGNNRSLQISVIIEGTLVIPGILENCLESLEMSRNLVQGSFGINL